jgi:carboxypeptidase Taq
MESKLAELKTRLMEVNDLESAGSVLFWDQTTYMPPGGTAGRARQLATLSQLAHAKATGLALGKLLDELRPYEESLPYDSDDASLIRLARRDYEHSTKVPSAFIAEISAHTAKSYEVWTKARPANDFAAVRPYLEKTLDYSRQYAEFFPGYEHVADPLIDSSDYGMKASTIRAVFAQLHEQLVPIVKAITSQPLADDSCLEQFYAEAQQLAFGIEIVKKFGYDFERGRQDKTAHPYMTRFSSGDVRILTRVQEHDLSDALFSTLHEAGHGMYEQGINPDFDGTPLARGASSGVHESQSRLWENVVGRSRAFWEHYYPALQAIFCDQLENVSVDTFYRAINKVQPSLIRTDADEVTYNLHVLLRFDLELALLEGNLRVSDLPEAWNGRYQSDLGIAAPNDTDGVMQDVHWYFSWIGGMFQGYTLGNIMSAQFYEAALKACPQIPAEIGRGEFGTLHGWMRDNIYQHGRKFTAEELLQRTTGGPLDIAPYIRYLSTKYGALYHL